jgi:hypothetical protein
MPRALFLVSLVLALVPLSAHAQDGDRYRLERTESGFVRMDTQTGRMSFCTESAGELICRTAAEGAMSADGDQFEALERRIDALERRIAILEGNPPSNGTSALPSEEEFEQTMSFMERFLRRFMGIVKDLEGETQQEEPAPDRT